MIEPGPAARAGAAAQLHDAARAARQVAADRETAPAPSPPPEDPAAPGPGNAAPIVPDARTKAASPSDRDPAR